ncbi:MAG TPA: MFS transporter [Dehalococcoidales bacterium]|nr:MFS transporter [Dehalococcoidales bacterium]
MDEYRGSGVGWGPAGGGWRNTLRNLKTFSSLKNRVFRIYFVAMLCQTAPMHMQMFARSFLVYQLTGSAAILGALALANAVPMLLLSLFGGVIADRVQKKHVVFAGHIVSAAVSLGVALTLTTGYLSVENTGSWWVLMVASAFQGAIMGLTMPSREAIIREIVTAEQLLNAISLNTMGMNSLRLFAPGLTGILIDVFDFDSVYYVMTGLYLLAALFMAILPHTSRTTTGSVNVLAEVKEGFRYIRGQTTILFVLLFLLLGIVLSMPYSLLMPVFCVDILKVDVKGMGILLSVSGAGAVFGSLVLASLPNKKRGLMMLGSTLLLSLALTAFSFSASWNASLALIIFVGLGQSGQMTLAGTLIQYYVDPAYLGRVMSILMMQFGLISFSTFAAGLLTEVVGVQWAVGGFAMGLILLSVLVLAFVPRLRNLD